MAGLDERLRKAKEKLKQLKARKRQLEARKRNTEKAAERKARDRELYNAAGLLVLAGLLDSKTGLPTLDRDELLGALLGLAKVPPSDPRRAEWERAGDALLAEPEKTGKSSKRPPADRAPLGLTIKEEPPGIVNPKQEPDSRSAPPPLHRSNGLAPILARLPPASRAVSNYLLKFLSIGRKEPQP